MEQVNYTDLLPKKPPVDLAKWLMEEAVGFKRQYLIYQAAWTDKKDQNGHKIQAAKVVCSSCGGTFFADKIAAGGATITGHQRLLGGSTQVWEMT